VTAPGTGITSGLKVTQEVPSQEPLNVERLMDQVRVRLSPRRPEMTVLLDPPELGRLLIKLSMKAGELTATVRADHAEVARAFEGDVARLYRTLDEAGIRVSEVQIQTGLGSADEQDPRDAGADTDVEDRRDRRNDRDESKGDRKAPSTQTSVGKRDATTVATTRASTLDLMI